MNNLIKIFNGIKDAPFKVLADIIDRCNVDCWYCYNHKPRTNRIMNLSILYKYLCNVKDIIGRNIQLTLIGGEPTLHPQLFNFLQMCHKNILIDLFTNLQLNTDFYNKIIKLDAQLLITYHLANQPIKQFINKLKALDRLDAIDTINVMLDPYNFQKCIIAYKIIKYNFPNVRIICNLLDDFDKNAQQYNRTIIYSTKQLTQYNDLIHDNQYSNIMYAQYSDGKIKKISLNQLKNESIYNFNHWKCSAGKDFINIALNGDVKKCAQKSLPICNIYTYTQHQLSFTATICTTSKCPCGFELDKEKVFF